MRTLQQEFHRPPLVAITAGREGVTLQYALRIARAMPSSKVLGVAKVAQLYREKVVDKPHGRCGYTFSEWARIVDRLSKPAYQQGRLVIRSEAQIARLKASKNIRPSNYLFIGGEA